MSYYKFGDHFKWFVARVSDLKDPEYIGRVRIRIIHNQTGELGKFKQGKSGIRNDELLWAWPLSGIQSASLNWRKLAEKEAGLEEFNTPDWIDAVGISPTGIAVGTYVFGFYLDAHEQNIPIIFGTYHKASVYPEPVSDDPSVNSLLQLEKPEEPQFYSDVAALARGKDGDGGQTLPKEPYTQAQILTTTSEPRSAYNTEYPYNVTYTTKSGHAIELDDTVGHERIHIWHRSGSYEEISNGPPNEGERFKGRRVKKTVGDDYEIVLKNKNTLVKENQNQEIAKNRTTRILIDDTKSVGNTMNYTVGNDWYATVENDIRFIAGGTLYIKAPAHTLIDGPLTVTGDLRSNLGANGRVSVGDKVLTIAGGIITEIDRA